MFSVPPGTSALGLELTRQTWRWQVEDYHSRHAGGPGLAGELSKSKWWTNPHSPGSHLWTLTRLRIQQQKTNKSTSSLKFWIFELHLTLTRIPPNSTNNILLSGNSKRTFVFLSSNEPFHQTKSNHRAIPSPPLMTTQNHIKSRQIVGPPSPKIPF